MVDIKDLKVGQRVKGVFFYVTILEVYTDKILIQHDTGEKQVWEIKYIEPEHLL